MLIIVVQRSKGLNRVGESGMERGEGEGKSDDHHDEAKRAVVDDLPQDERQK
jgi:hypothetical protein